MAILTRSKHAGVTPRTKRLAALCTKRREFARNEAWEKTIKYCLDAIITQWETEEEPTEPAEEEPVEPADEEPTERFCECCGEERSEPADEEPTEPTDEEPIDLTEEEPIEPADEEPVEPAEEEPIEPADEEPVEPAEEEPIEPAKEELAEIEYEEFRAECDLIADQYNLCAFIANKLELAAVERMMDKYEDYWQEEGPHRSCPLDHYYRQREIELDEIEQQPDGSLDKPFVLE